MQPGADSRHPGAGRVASVTIGSGSAPSPQPAEQLLGAQLDDDDQRLDDDPAAHLRLADAAVAERDRDLADARARRGLARNVISIWKT